MLDAIPWVLALVIVAMAGLFAVWAVLRLRTGRRLPGDFDFDFHKRQEPK